MHVCGTSHTWLCRLGCPTRLGKVISVSWGSSTCFRGLRRAATDHVAQTLQNRSPRQEHVSVNAKPAWGTEPVRARSDQAGFRDQEFVLFETRRIKQSPAGGSDFWVSEFQKRVRKPIRGFLLAFTGLYSVREHGLLFEAETRSHIFARASQHLELSSLILGIQGRRHAENLTLGECSEQGQAQRRRAACEISVRTGEPAMSQSPSAFHAKPWPGMTTAVSRCVGQSPCGKSRSRVRSALSQTFA